MSYILIICCLTLVSILSTDGSCVDLNPKSKCYSNQISNPLRFYGTKTTYTVAKEALESSHIYPDYEIPECEPIMFYFIGRHAIRYPDGEDIVEMSQVLSQLQKKIIKSAEKGLTQLCEQDLQSIRNWKLRMNESDDNRISDTGLLETQRLAKDFKQRFPILLDSNKAKIEIGITTKERTEQTADAFIQQIRLNQNSNKESSEESFETSSEEEVFDNKNSNELTKNENPILYFHDTCKELLSEQGVKLEKPKLVKELRSSDLMKSLINRVNERMGFRTDDGIDAQVLRQIVRACQFDFAIHEQSSGWCSLLGDEEIKILEYLDDIEDFYEDAYGRNINGRQTCPLIGDIVRKVKKSIKNSKEKKSFLHFTHAGVMKRLYSGLGLFNTLSHNIDNKSDESVCLGDDRKWKSSLICPFSANFAAVLYKCSKNKDNKNDDKKYGKYKLLTLVQEKPVLIKGCDSYLCSVDKFIDSYREITSNCNLKEICKI